MSLYRDQLYARAIEIFGEYNGDLWIRQWSEADYSTRNKMERLLAIAEDGAFG